MGGQEFSNIHFVHSTIKQFWRHIGKWKVHQVIGKFAKDFEIIFSEYFYFADHLDYQQIYTIAASLLPYQ